MLYDSLPDKVVDGVFYKVDDKYMLVSYKSLLKDLMDGYNLTQIGENLYKQSRNGVYCKFRDLSSVVKEMKQDFKDFLASEYHFTKEKYDNGGTVLW